MVEATLTSIPRDLFWWLKLGFQNVLKLDAFTLTASKLVIKETFTNRISVKGKTFFPVFAE